MSVKFWLEKLVPLVLISAVFGASVSWAQGQPFIVPPPTGTPLVSGTPFQSVNQACDKYGTCNVAVGGGASGLGMSIIPVSNSAGLNGPLTSNNGYFNVGTDTIEALSTTTVLVLTAHVARVGDLIIPTAGTAGNVDVAIPICSVATNSVTLCYPLPATPSTDAILIRRPNPIVQVKEDTAALGGDLGYFMLVQRNDTPGAVATNGDFIPPTVGAAGGLYVDLDVRAQGSATNSPIRLEDAAFGASEPVVMAGVMNRGANPFEPTSGSSNDIEPVQADVEGRMAVNAWGSQPAEFWRGCGTATAVTSDVIIKAAVASTLTYVTSVTCKNTSTTVGPNLDFKDDTTVIAVGAIAANSATGVLNSSYTTTFPTPLRVTSNKNFNFATNAATSSVTCCGAGFTSNN